MSATETLLYPIESTTVVRKSLLWQSIGSSDTDGSSDCNLTMRRSMIDGVGGFVDENAGKYMIV